jgi:hypothetical protein
MIGHLIAAFCGVFLTVLVDFGVPLSDAQQRDLLSLVVTGWALFAGAYAWLSRAKHPVSSPPRQQTVTGTAPTSGPAGGASMPLPLDTYGRVTGIAPAPTAAWPPPTAAPQSWPPYNGGYGQPTVNDHSDEAGPPQPPYDRHEQGPAT